MCKTRLAGTLDGCFPKPVNIGLKDDKIMSCHFNHFFKMYSPHRPIYFCLRLYFLLLQLLLLVAKVPGVITPATLAQNHQKRLKSMMAMEIVMNGSHQRKARKTQKPYFSSSTTTMYRLLVLDMP